MDEEPRQPVPDSSDAPRRVDELGLTPHGPEDDILARAAARKEAGEPASDDDRDPSDPSRFTTPRSASETSNGDAGDEPAIFQESVDTIRQWLDQGRELRRTTIVSALHDALEVHDWVIAAWLGGADAYGRVDRYSDIDLFVEAEDRHVEEVFAEVEQALEELAGIGHRWTVPEPTWHGGHERVYRLAEASQYLLVDLVVTARSKGRAAASVERHGVPRFLFDRTGVGVDASSEPDSQAHMINARLTELGVRVPMLHVLVDKELLRGDALAAMEMYRRFIHGPLIELVRMRYAPSRWDFGLLHARRDLPKEVWQRLEDMLYVADVEELRNSWLQARRWMLNLLEELANEQPVE